MTTTEFLGSAFWKILIGFIWYKSLIFRPLKHNTARESLVRLSLMTLAFFSGWTLLFFGVGNPAGPLQPVPFFRSKYIQ